jgi:hypothetical protein
VTSTEKKELEAFRLALQQIRAICRNGTLLEFTKLLEIYELTGTLDKRLTMISDLRSGKK